jgi:hypothetical protein
VLGNVTPGIEKAVGGKDLTTPVKDLGVPAVSDSAPAGKSGALLEPVLEDVLSAADKTVDHQIVADVQERVGGPADEAVGAAIPADQVGTPIEQVATPIVRAPAPAPTERSAPSPGPGGSPPDARRLSATAVTRPAGAANRPASSGAPGETYLSDSLEGPTDRAGAVGGPAVPLAHPLLPRSADTAAARTAGSTLVAVSDAPLARVALVTALEPSAVGPVGAASAGVRSPGRNTPTAPPAGVSGAGAGPAAGSIFILFLALTTLLALWLAGSSTWLRLRPAAWRPMPLVSLLERPG